MAFKFDLNIIVCIKNAQQRTKNMRNHVFIKNKETDVDQIEINEAFGAQTLACAKELEIPLEKLNTCGGAIALGHPLAASGSRISAHLVHKLRRNGDKYGIGSACIGGGQGISILFEAM